MANINEILARAAALRNETALNSIDPERAGGIMYDTLIALNELWLQQGAALVLSKIYASVAAMNADTSPVSDLTGRPIRPGMVVVIASSDSDNGSVYRYNGPDSPSWSLVGKIGNLEPVDSLDSDSTQLPLAARQGKVLDEKISQLGQNLLYFKNEVEEKLYPITFSGRKAYVFDGVDDVMTLNSPITLERDGDFVEICVSTTLIDANKDIATGHSTGGTNNLYSFAYRQHPTNPNYKYPALAFSRNRFFGRMADSGATWIGLFQASAGIGDIPNAEQTTMQVIKVAFVNGWIRFYVNGVELDTNGLTPSGYQPIPYQYASGDKIVINGFGQTSGSSAWFGKIYSIKTKDGYIDLSAQTFNGAVVSIEGAYSLEEVLNEQRAEIASNVKYLECGSSESDDKIITNESFVLSESCRFTIKFTHRNSKTNPTLKIGGTAEKALYYNGSVASSENTWSDGDTLDVYYDGEKYNAFPLKPVSAAPFDENGMIARTLRDGLAFAKLSIPPSPWFDGEGVGYDYLSYLDKRIAGVPDGKSFIFITDTHYATNKKHSAELIDYVRRKLGIRTIISGGDVENESANNLTNAVSQWVNFNNDFVTRLGKDFKQVCGDHDHNGAGAAAGIAFKYQFVQKMLNGYCEDSIIYDTLYEDDSALQALTSGWTTDDKAEYNAWQKMHYYFDDETINTRFIVLHTGWSGAVGLAVDYFGDADVLNDYNAAKLQMDFLYRALTTASPNQNIVVAGHNTISSLRTTIEGVTGRRMNVNRVVANSLWYGIHRMLHAFKNKTVSQSVPYRNWTDYKNGGSKTYDFTSVKDCGVIMEIGGDIHYDMLGASRLNGNTIELVAIENVVELRVPTNGTLQPGDIPTVTTTTDGIDRNYRGIIAVPGDGYNDETDSFPLNHSFNDGDSDYTDKTQSFDIVTITPNAIHFTRIGDGRDRVVTLNP